MSFRTQQPVYYESLAQKPKNEPQTQERGDRVVVMDLIAAKEISRSTIKRNERRLPEAKLFECLLAHECCHHSAIVGDDVGSHLLILQMRVRLAR